MLKERAGADSDSRNKKGKENVSAYCRKLLFSGHTGRKSSVQELRELNFQIRKIGVNINQAAKRMNSGYGQTGDGLLLLTELEAVERLLRCFQETQEESKWQ